MLITSHNGNRYWDGKWQSWVLTLRQGESIVSDEDVLINTVLGSCVAACIFDPIAGIGGMNHFLLPVAGPSEPTPLSFRYGVHAMEMLVNTLLKNGAERDRLRVKITGAADIVSGMSTRAGTANSAFIRDYLATEALTLAAADLGGNQARRVVFNPLSGSMKVKKLSKPLDSRLIMNEETRAEELSHVVDEQADVALFDTDIGKRK